MTIIHLLVASSEFQNRGVNKALSDTERENIDKLTIDICKDFDDISLSVSKRVCENMFGVATTYGQMTDAVRQVFNTMSAELNGRKFYAPLRDLDKYFEEPKLFGEDVFVKFPSANNDIFEAGTCLALDRGTACVMHSMRVMEVGLAALAKALGVGPKNDWGSYLREIDKELSARMKVSGARSADEQFYAESSVTIDGMRRAWRNPTMHVENSYSSERAEEILLAVKSFMRHLATKISE